ncbi:pilus assembly protein PilN, partial [Burkholderia gladioli]
TRPLLRAIALFEVLHRLDYRAVMLIALRQAEGGVRIDARARDSLAASRWLARLREARSDWQVEMSGVEGEPGQGTTGTIRFAVRIRWPDAVPLPRAARADFSVARGGRR